MVVGYHAFSHRLIAISNGNSDDFMWLQFGVAIFFVISGYVMLSSTRDRTPAPCAFLMRRIKRIVPLYWTVTACSLMASGGSDPLRVLCSLFFIPLIDTATGQGMAPILDVGWTLNYEMGFYALFALSLYLPRRLAVPAVIGLLVGLSSLPPPDDANGLGQFLFQPFLLDFAAGMMIAHLRLRAPRWMLPLGFLLLALLHQGVAIRLLAVTVPAALIVAAGLSWDGALRKWRTPMMLGDASYAIYLTHLFVLFALRDWLSPAQSPVLMLGLALVASGLAGLLVHILLERRLFKWVAKAAHDLPRLPRQRATLVQDQINIGMGQ